MHPGFGRYCVVPTSSLGLLHRARAAASVALAEETASLSREAPSSPPTLAWANSRNGLMPGQMHSTPDNALPVAATGPDCRNRMMGEGRNIEFEQLGNAAHMGCKRPASAFHRPPRKSRSTPSSTTAPRKGWDTQFTPRRARRLSHQSRVRAERPDRIRPNKSSPKKAAHASYRIPGRTETPPFTATARLRKASRANW